MAFKPAGAPCDLYRENVVLNPTSFAVNGTCSDDFRTNANWDGETFRPTHLHDATAYAVQSTRDSFGAKILGTGLIP